MTSGVPDITMHGTSFSGFDRDTSCPDRGINKNISLHTLRHSFATDLCRETSKIRLVQKVLGHSNLSITMVCTHIFDEEGESALKSLRQPMAVAV